MELLAGLLLLGPLFWITVVVFISLSIFTFEMERYSWTGISVLIGVAVLSWFSGFPIIEFVKNNAVSIVLGVLAYVAIGAIYSAIRFAIFTFETSAALTQYCEKNGYKRNALTEADLKNFVLYSRVKNIPLRVSDHTEQMLAWAVYWPISAFWTLTHKPIRWMIETCQRLTAKILQKISDRAFGDIVVIKDEPSPRR